MFPKEGKVLYGRAAKNTAACYALAVAGALRWELGDSHRATKTIMGWTGATERTVKNWLAGTNGPTGEHLVSLVSRSDAVFTAFVDLTGRPLFVPTLTLIAARDALDKVLQSANLQ